tara:strand:+ start:156 stop:266 length:111 start_codon:yes stop_codon:yes gene_type:complete
MSKTFFQKLAEAKKKGKNEKKAKKETVNKKGEKTLN